jgi:acetyl-CoA C-acetyltransferase
MSKYTFENVFFDLNEAWSSPFVRWKGALQDIHSLDLATQVTSSAISQRNIEIGSVGQVIYGQTVPQRQAFYAGPTFAARVGLTAVTGPTISQACATSVAGLALGGASLESGSDDAILIVMSDRTSNSPLVTYPSSIEREEDFDRENWVSDNFEKDPWGGTAMAATAENLATAVGISRAEADDMTILRHEQYQMALSNNRQFHRKFMVPVASSGGEVIVDRDAGIYPLDEVATRALDASIEGGVVTRDTQTHPADGTAGLLLRTRETTKGPVVKIHSAGFARVERSFMPKAVVPAAHLALKAANKSIDDVNLVNTHNPFIVSDIYFAREFGFDPSRMNARGCSLVYGHPQGPTGLRAIIELAHSLMMSGGGVGLFTGCAAGDTAGAVVIEVMP